MDTPDLLLQVQHEQIRAVGWAVTAVVPTPAEPCPPFAYTVGLTEANHPELLIAGLDEVTSMELLNRLAARVRHGGLRLSHGQHLSAPVAGHDTVIVEGPASDTLSPATAHARYGRDQVTLAQIVWPCPHHRFPWQDGYCHATHPQPLLATP